MKKKLIYIAVALIVIIIAAVYYGNMKKSSKVTVAIANFGPHASLDASIKGFKEQLATEGFVEGKNISYEVADVAFDAALINQMIAGLEAKNPKLMMVMTTPVAQAAKAKVTNIPLIYNVITDPVDAGLIKEKNKSGENITGSSDLQDFKMILSFVKTVLPKAKRLGILYATAEANDVAQVKMITNVANELGMKVVAIPVEKASDVPFRAKEFKGKVDFLYAGAGGLVQSSLPSLSAEARKLKLPIFNLESQAVKDGLALASYGVDYVSVGKNAGKLAAEVLRGKKPIELTPLYPTAADYSAVINKKLANELGATIPANAQVVE